METNIICPNCHQPVEEGAVFCGNCGQPLEKPMTTVQSPAPAPTTPSRVFGSNESTPITQPQLQPVMAGASINSTPYAIAEPASKAETKSIIGLILGTIGIPASILIPILGLALGVAGLILGTISRSRYKHTLNLLAIIFSTLAIVASLGIWVWNIDRNHSASVVNDGSSLSSISTPCFNLKLDSSLKGSKLTGCDLDYSNATEEVSINSVTNEGITTSNLKSESDQVVAKEQPELGVTFSNQRIGTFAGSPAFLANVISQNAAGVFAIVLHQTSDGENVFIITRFILGTQFPQFGVVQSSWEWK